jgi:CubicO group peptidase (beta-lactamase class C family)
MPVILCPARATNPSTKLRSNSSKARMIRLIRLHTVLALCLSLPSAGFAQTSLQDQIKRYVSAAQDSGAFHGAILVAHRGVVVYEHSAGYANYEWRVANTPDTRFRIGSITKQFTALLVFQLAQAGVLSLNDAISEHLPYYRKDTGSRVTIAHLLNHASGIPDLSRDFSEKYERNAYQTEEFVRLFCSGDLESVPGEKYRYSNAGYYILGALLEQVTGKKYGDLLQEKIFGPLGMSDSGYIGDLQVVENKASGYRRGNSGHLRVTNAALLDPSVAFSFGGIHSTVRDLYKWDRALYTDRLLTTEFRARLFTPAAGGSYGNGWIHYFVQVPGENRKLPVTMHQGSINGYSGVIFRNLATQDLVVILNNVGSDGSEWKLGESLMLMLN